MNYSYTHISYIITLSTQRDLKGSKHQGYRECRYIQLSYIEYTFLTFEDTYTWNIPYFNTFFNISKDKERYCTNLCVKSIKRCFRACVFD